MPKYYCDYCDTFLTHDAPRLRKVHLTGRKHRENVLNYYQNVLDQNTQKMIDEISKGYKKNQPASMGFHPYMRPDINQGSLSTRMPLRGAMFPGVPMFSGVPMLPSGSMFMMPPAPPGFHNQPILQINGPIIPGTAFGTSRQILPEGGVVPHDIIPTSTPSGNPKSKKPKKH